MRITFVLTLAAVLAVPVTGAAQAANQEAAAVLMKADRDFARSVADKNRDAFLAFVADITTFNGGTKGEIHGRDAVWKEWATFFDSAGPTLTWAPTRAEILGAGDLGYTIGRSILGATGADGKVTERRGEYLTVWRRQEDGSWKVVFDTGSTLLGGNK